MAHLLTRLAVLLCTCVAARLPATELYSWHTFDTSVADNQRIEVLLHSRLRTRDALTDVQQVRFGPIGRVRINRRLIWFTGYYFQPGDNGARQWGAAHRIFSGIEVPIQRKSIAVTCRVAAERHFHSLDRDYNRYRTYTRLMWGRHVAPFVQNEWLAVNGGFHSVRNSVGVRFPIGSQSTLEFGYLYDYRRQVWGGDRQAIVTSLRFHTFRREAN